MNEHSLKSDVIFLSELLVSDRLTASDIPSQNDHTSAVIASIATRIALDDKQSKENIIKVIGDEQSMEHPDSEKCDVLIVTPLAKEQTMACLAFDRDPSKEDENASGATKEYSFKLSRPNGRRDLAVTISALARQTNIQSAAITTNLLTRHHPEIAILAGIGATFPDRAHLGHVIAGNIVYYTEGGVQHAEHKDPRLKTFSTDTTITTLLEYFGDTADKDSWRNDALEKIKTKWDEIDGKKPQMCEVEENGTSFSVNAVMSQEKLRRDSKSADEALLIDQNIKSVEMEAAGFASACENYTPPKNKPNFPSKIGWTVFRGHCDFGDSEKRDTWQRVAAFYAAYSVRSFLETEFKTLEEMKL